MAAAPRPFPDDDEEPWSEAEWLADQKRRDARAAKYGELLETLLDEPDSEEQIAREMGWDRDDEPEDDEGGEEDSEADPDWKVPSVEEMNRIAQEAIESGDLEDDDDDDDEPPGVALDYTPKATFAREDVEDDDPDPFPRGGYRERCEKIAEFRHAEALGWKMNRLLAPLRQRVEKANETVDADDEDADHDPSDGNLAIACIGPHIAAAKIVNGSSLGYDLHHINGNLAVQHLGVAGVNDALDAMDELLRLKLVSPELHAELRGDLLELRERLLGRMERMREHFKALYELRFGRRPE
jgi:hypothetical protein